MLALSDQTPGEGIATPAHMRVEPTGSAVSGVSHISTKSTSCARVHCIA